jgi:hypothetical protein
MTICVFTGPTISAGECLAELDAVYLPPVAQGDVFRLARREPKAIGIVDGYFDHVAAVWHKEILWAMSQGIHVYGSASMGALRAAELAPFGMRGVGAIFESFLEGTLEDDDEVAVAHGLADSGYRSASDAMVNIRATLARAEAEGVLAAATRAQLERIAKERFYPDRSLRTLPRLGAEAGLPAAELDCLADWLPSGTVNLKREDALDMLRLMREELADDAPPKRLDFHMEHTDFWQNVMRAETQDREGEETSVAPALPRDAVLEELRLQGATYLQVRDHGLLRDLAVSEAQHFGHGARDETFASAATRLRERLGLRDDSEFEQWLRDNHLTPERFDALARAEADLDKLRWARGEGPHLIDQLRLTGRYRVLLERALEKQRRLAAAGRERPTLTDTGLTAEELMDWYFGRIGPLYPPDAKRHAATFGFQKVEALTQAVLREYWYVRLGEAPQD